MRNVILQGDALSVLRTLPDNYVQCVATSPPYYALRNYQTEPQVWDGDPVCPHTWETCIQRDQHGDTGLDGSTLKGGLETQAQTRFDRVSAFCQRCNAWRGSLGLEPNPDLFVAHLVQIFREVRRVLRKDGTCWVNIGDSYAANRSYQVNDSKWCDVGNHNGSIVPPGLKPKDLMMIPARVALALQADGWWLRSDIIWHKLTAMPESCLDRPTSAHEHVFLLAKSEQYFYDADAIREPLRPKTFTTFGIKHHEQGNDALGKVKSDNWGRTVAERQPRLTADGTIAGANKRNVWPLSAQPYSEAHFATFPEKLVSPMILSGSSPQACEHCGAPWERVTERGVSTFKATTDPTIMTGRKGLNRQREALSEQRALALPQAQIAHKLRQAAKGRETEMIARYGSKWAHWTRTDESGARVPTREDWQDIQLVLDINEDIETQQIGSFRATCSCPNNTGSGKCVVLDPFMGSGTVAKVALEHHRDYLGIELNPSYIAMAEKRIATVQPNLWEAVTRPVDDMPVREVEAWGNVLEGLFPEEEGEAV